MVDLISVDTVNHNDVEVTIKYPTDPSYKPEGKHIFAKYVLGNWIVFTQDASVVTGELEEAIVNFCNKEFPFENVLKKPRKRCFLLEEMENV